MAIAVCRRCGQAFETTEGEANKPLDQCRGGDRLCRSCHSDYILDEVDKHPLCCQAAIHQFSCSCGNHWVDDAWVSTCENCGKNIDTQGEGCKDD